MSIDKWLNGKDTKEERIRREQAFSRLSKEEVQELKKKKIRDVVKKDIEKSAEISERDKFLREIIEFKDWLSQRTYLKGDFDKIERWIKNLYSSIKLESERKKNLAIYDDKKNIINKYKEIPPGFLDEKTRVAISKLIHGTKRTNSDNYYIRKLKSLLKEKLKEAEYYNILDKLFKLF
jgi:hypothetical protein